MTESKICTCPSGDGSLVHPCPAHPAVEQAGWGGERAAFELFVRKHCGMPAHIAVNWDAKFTNDAWEGWKARAALAQPSPVQAEQAEGAHVPDEVFAGVFAEWWEEEGQYCRAGGGDYERTFAFQAWRHLYPLLLQDRAALAQPSPDAPYADDIAADLERSDWTPEDALRWYAAGKHFDTVNGRTRIIDTGAVASNALKHLSLPYLEMKGDAELTELREAMAQPSPVRSSLLINGYQLRAALDFIAPDGTAEQLESEACIEWRQQDADFLEAGLYAFCAEYPEEGGVLLDEEPATAQPSPLQSEQAEAERPEVAEVAFVLRNIGAMDAEDIDGDNVDLRFEDAEGRDTGCDASIVEYAEKAADLLEQQDRIVGELRAENAKLSEALDECDGDRWKLRSERDAANARLHEVATACATAEQERDAALARVAELTPTRNRYGVDAHYFNKNLQRILRDFESFTTDELARSLIILAKVADEKVVAQAQHSVPEGFIGRLSEFLAQRGTTGKALLRELRAMLAAAPAQGGE